LLPFSIGLPPVPELVKPEGGSGRIRFSRRRAIRRD
jgi:hypothetical protein